MTLLKTVIASFKQDITRDLFWTVFAPSLLNVPGIPAFSPELTDARIAWLKTFDDQQHEIKPDYRLGRYYESLWTTFFQHDPQYELLAQNIAVTKDNKTLGELDFIVLDHLSQRFIHIEVAVKFYLFHPSSNMPGKNKNSAWLGPNSQDNLQKKWQHLIQHQCQMSKQAEAIAILKQRSIDCEKLDQALCLKGYLFSPHNTENTPEFFNKENTLYNYYTLTEFTESDFDNNLLCILPKQHWLTQVHERSSIVPLAKTEIINFIQKKQTPVMIAILDNNKEYFHELNRFFITPESWPDTKHVIS